MSSQLKIKSLEDFLPLLQQWKSEGKNDSFYQWMF